MSKSLSLRSATRLACPSAPLPVLANVRPKGSSGRTPQIARPFSAVTTSATTGAPSAAAAVVLTGMSANAASTATTTFPPSRIPAEPVELSSDDALPSRSSPPSVASSPSPTANASMHQTITLLLWIELGVFPSRNAIKEHSFKEKHAGWESALQERPSVQAFVFRLWHQPDTAIKQYSARLLVRLSGPVADVLHASSSVFQAISDDASRISSPPPRLSVLLSPAAFPLSTSTTSLSIKPIGSIAPAYLRIFPDLQTYSEVAIAADTSGPNPTSLLDKFVLTELQNFDFPEPRFNKPHSMPVSSSSAPLSTRTTPSSLEEPSETAHPPEALPSSSSSSSSSTITTFPLNQPSPLSAQTPKATSSPRITSNPFRRAFPAEQAPPALESAMKKAPVRLSPEKQTRVRAQILLPRPIRDQLPSNYESAAQSYAALSGWLQLGPHVDIKLARRGKHHNAWLCLNGPAGLVDKAISSLVKLVTWRSNMEFTLEIDGMSLSDFPRGELELSAWKTLIGTNRVFHYKRRASDDRDEEHRQVRVVGPPKCASAAIELLVRAHMGKSLEKTPGRTSFRSDLAAPFPAPSSSSPNPSSSFSSNFDSLASITTPLRSPISTSPSAPFFSSTPAPPIPPASLDLASTNASAYSNNLTPPTPRPEAQPRQTLLQMEASPSESSIAAPPPPALARRLRIPSVQSFNADLARILLQPATRDVSPLSSALRLAANMKHLDVQPNGTTYSTLLLICLRSQDERAAASASLAPHWLEARQRLLQSTGETTPEARFGSYEWELGWGFWKDAEAKGVEVPAEGKDALMKLALIDPTLAAQVRAVLFKRGVAPTPHSVEAALAPYLDPPSLLPSGKVDPSAGLDKILSIYADARAQGVLPTKEVVGLVAARLAAIGWGTAALEMAEDFEANAASLGGAAKEAAVLSANAWEALLRGFVKHRQTSLFASVWDLVVAGRCNPSVGLLHDCLSIAGESGLPELAIDIYQRLGDKSIAPTEAMIAPIVQAWLVAGELEPAFYSLSIMRSEGVDPSESTIQLIIDAIVRDKVGSASPDAATERVAEAWGSLLKSMEARGSVDESTGDLILRACLDAANYSLAIEIFTTGFNKLQLSRSLDTYCLFLDAITLQPAGTYPVFERAFGVLRNNLSALTPPVFERLVAYLCTQPTTECLDQALTLFDTCVRSGASPTARTFDVLVRRCANEDHPRTRQIVGAMRIHGVLISPMLRRYLREHAFGADAGRRPREPGATGDQAVGIGGWAGQQDVLALPDHHP